MSDFLCPECKDTGIYQGLNTVEPCRACGGKQRENIPPLNLTASPKRFESALETAGRILAKAARESGGQSIRHEIEEQTTEPKEVFVTLTKNSLVSVHCETRDIDMGYRIQKELLYRRLTLSAVNFDKQGMDHVSEAYLARKPIKVTCTFNDGSNGSIAGTVSGWHITFATMEGSLTLIEGSADA